LKNELKEGQSQNPEKQKNQVCDEVGRDWKKKQGAAMSGKPGTVLGEVDKRRTGVHRTKGKTWSNTGNPKGNPRVRGIVKPASHTKSKKRVKIKKTATGGECPRKM